MAKRILLAGLMAWFAGNTNAAIITLDADAMDAGTNVSHLLPGVTIASYRQMPDSAVYSPVVTDITVFDCMDPTYCGSRTGGRQFGIAGSGPFSPGNFGFSQTALACEQGSAFDCFDGFSTLELRFDRPTDYISFDTQWLSDQPGFLALDAAGAVVASCLGFSSDLCARTNTADGSGGSYTLVELMRSERDISRVIFGGRWGASRVGEISVSVPEPSTLLLLVAGLLGTVLVRRKKPALV